MISVIIPTFQRPSLLCHALRSVDSQAYKDFEVIVVNDGGPSLETSIAPWRRAFPLRLIESSERRGPASARNVGIEHAAGEYIAFLDDDDVFLPTHLGAAHEALAGRRELDFVYLGALVSDRRLSALPPDWSEMHMKSYEFDDRFLLVANYIHTGSVVVRNFTGSQVRFDESLTHCEDWDLWLALRLDLRYEVTFVDRLTSIYHQVPRSAGLVAQAQTSVPSPFTIVRERLHAKWPTADDYVLAYREWLTAFESYRNQVIADRRAIPTHLFDRVLRYLYRKFSSGDHADPSTIPV